MVQHTTYPLSEFDLPNNTSNWEVINRNIPIENNKYQTTSKFSSLTVVPSSNSNDVSPSKQSFHNYPELFFGITICCLSYNLFSKEGKTENTDKNGTGRT